MDYAKILDEVSASLGGFLDRYDIDAIASEIEEKYPDAQNIDDVPSDDYWYIVANHDITEG